MHAATMCSLVFPDLGQDDIILRRLRARVQPDSTTRVRGAA
jgi:hypothetical protein